MKDSINKIYNAIINYIIDFFHVFKKDLINLKEKLNLNLENYIIMKYLVL